MNALAVEREAETGLADEEIVARVLKGEKELFEILVRRHNQRIYRGARAILRNDYEAEDVMQDAYVRAYRNLAQFRGDAKFSTWLTRIAVNEALGRLRGSARFTDLEEVPMRDMATPDESPERSAAAGEVRALLEQGLDRLSDQQRAVYVLRDVEEMNTEDTASSLGLTEDNVKILLHRARRQLRNFLLVRAGSHAPNLLQFHHSRCDRVTARVMAAISQATISQSCS
jgi:RNA polymerase sigma-70 factor (ECF subfamily)